MKIFPQEVEVWYLIPAIRKELAKSLIKDFGFNQKKVSEIFSVTEGAVSQYIKSKRGNELKFNKREIKELKETARKIVSNEKKAGEYIYKLCIKLRGTESLCKLHKKYDRAVPRNCGICMR